MKEITRETKIGELLMLDKDVTPVLLGIGMHCLGCPSSQVESIEEAALVHGINPDELIQKINDCLNA